MRKRIKPFSVGYFTDKTARALLSALDGGHPRPAALHIEPQSRTWISSVDTSGDKGLNIGHHADACARLLAGVFDSGNGSLGDAGIIDELTFPGRHAFIAAARHPDVRIMTVSSTQMFMHSFSYKDYSDLAQPVVLKAAGNYHDDWKSFRENETLCGEVYMPGYARVGEAWPSGEVYPGSQVSGPAFISDHPRDMRAILGGGGYLATREDVQNFLAWPYHHDFPVYRREALMAYQDHAEQVEDFPGTSAAAPYVGSLIMRHTAGMKGITSYDILPAALMAAQMNNPPDDADKRIETQSGMIFDPYHYGHGVLVEPCLAQRLRDVWQVRSMSGRATQEGEYSQPQTIEGRGHMSASTGRAQGSVVNVVLALSFVNDEPDGWKTEERIPQSVMLRSPQGTKIRLPILYERKLQYSEHVRAGYQTAAFFGEDISKGDWQISYPEGEENSLRVASMKIIAHTMHPKSPALVLFRAFQKALRIERSHEKAAPVTVPPSSLKP